MTMTETAEITVDQLAAWLAEQTWSDFAQSLASYHAKKGYLSEKQEASARKMYAKIAAKAEAKKSAKPTSPVIEAGMYKLGTDIYKVQKVVHGSGNLYAKRLVPGTEFGDKATFEYAPGMVSRLDADDKLSLDEAKAFGALYGTCCNCGRTLTDETSIAAGIGPICAQGFGA